MLGVLASQLRRADHAGLCILLALGLAFALAALQLREAIAPQQLAGFNSELKWLSVSNEAIDENVGLRPFTRKQVEALVQAFPQHALIAATMAAEFDVLVDRQPARPNIQFVRPEAFAIGGVHLLGTVLPAGESFCVASQRWRERGHQDARTVTLAGARELALQGSVDPRLLMFAGLSSVDIWCSWDLVGGTVLPEQSQEQLAEQPIYWLYVGAADANGLSQWRARTAAIELPRVMGLPGRPHKLVSLDGWVNHPSIQRAALDRLQRLESLGFLFIGFGLALTLFLALQRARRRRTEMAVRSALGASLRQLLLPVVHAHLWSGVLGLVLGSFGALLLTHLLWMDASFTEARFSGVSLAQLSWRSALALYALLWTLSLAWEVVAVASVARARRLDASREALPGLHGVRAPLALLLAFGFVAAWAILSQLATTLSPRGVDFGLPAGLRLTTNRFQPGGNVFDHMLTAAQLRQLASDVEHSLGDDFAIAENYPSYTGAVFPGTVKGADGSECGQAGEVLRGTDKLLPRLVPGMLVGAAPAARGQMAVSRTRAIRCFGTVERALGARLSLPGEHFDVVGVYPDIDWNLGRGMRSAFVAPLSAAPLSFGGVAFAGTADSVVAAVMTQHLKALKPDLVDVGISDFDSIAAGLYRADVVQARMLTVLGSLLGIGAMLACAALFAVLLGERRAALALHLALGASPARLLRHWLSPLLLLGAVGTLLLPWCGVALVRRSSALGVLFDIQPQAPWSAAVLTVLAIVAIATWHLLRVLRSPRLVAELHGA